jgi:succinate dehydrogenase / fumarate reductase, membrane anchor subunit
MSGGIRVSRAGRARPQGGGFELAVWYLMRLTGLGLFVLALAHYLITHVVFDSAIQTAEWVAAERWSSVAWRTLDWLMLSMVLFHAFLGVRIVLQDYVSGGARTLLTMGLYLLGLLLFAMGTMVVVTLPLPGA